MPTPPRSCGAHSAAPPPIPLLHNLPVLLSRSTELSARVDGLVSRAYPSPGSITPLCRPPSSRPRDVTTHAAATANTLQTSAPHFPLSHLPFQAFGRPRDVRPVPDQCTVCNLNVTTPRSLACASPATAIAEISSSLPALCPPLARSNRSLPTKLAPRAPLGHEDYTLRSSSLHLAPLLPTCFPSVAPPLQTLHAAHHCFCPPAMRPPSKPLTTSASPSCPLLACVATSQQQLCVPPSFPCQ